MMTYNKLPMIAIAIALASCSLVPEVEESPVDPDKAGKEEITLTAYCGEPETRTVRESDGSVLWSPGDEISLFYGSGSEGGSKFTAQNTEKAKVVNFRGEIGVITGGNDVSVEDTYFWATYPYCAEASCDGNSITTVLPSAQLATADTFADDLFPSIGRSRGLDMAFYNICGGIKFTVSEAGIKTVTLKGNSGEQIAGKITVGFDDNGIPIVLSIADGSDTITLSAPDDECLEVGKAYYIVLAPTVFESGFTMTFSKGLMQAVKNRTSKTTIRRSVFGTLTTPDKDLEWEILSTAVPPDNEIWYTSVDETILNLHQIDYTVTGVDMTGIDATLVSNEYNNGYGIMRFDRPITIVNHLFEYWEDDMFKLVSISFPPTLRVLGTNPWVGNLFGGAYNLEHVIIPEGVTEIGTILWHCQSIKEISIPNSLLSTETIAASCPNLTTIHGDGASKDGKTFSKNGVLIAFAPKGVTDYTLDDGIERISNNVFDSCEQLTRIVLPASLKQIDNYAFYNSGVESVTLPNQLLAIGNNAFEGTKLVSVTIPQSVISIGENAFRTNTLLEFSGKFASSDHMLLVVDGQLIGVAYPRLKQEKSFVFPSGLKRIPTAIFSGMSNFEEIVVNDDVESIGSCAFEGCSELRRITIPSSSTIIFGDSILSNCPRLEEINRENQTLGNRMLIGRNQMNNGSFPSIYQYGWHDNTLIAYASSGEKDIVLDADIIGIGNGAFAGATDLESIEIRSNIKSILSCAFASCASLKRVVLPPSLLTIEDCAFMYSSIDSIFIRAPKPPKLLWDVFPNTTTIVVPANVLDLYRLEWTEYASQIVGEETDLYMSTDYSSDGSVTTLQQSTIGAGINLILMGDAFSDRQIADGTYANVMQKAMNAFFSEEPYKSMKDCFNVYTVNVVSATEGYEHSGQAIETGHSDGANVYGNDSKVIEYAKKAVSEDRMDDALIIVMMNEDAYAGTCYMYNPPSGNYGRGLSIAYFPTSSNNDTFNGLVSHEAGGHGFAKLADEYAYEYLGAIPEDVATSEKARMLYGWNKNVDFTSDPLQVKWSQFLSDPRYANEGLGCFEGGLTYWTGVWRPSENSIMRYNTGGFNAPSRYAIWYRIGKLAYGESWEGSYEDFVAYDAINRTPAAVQNRQAQMRRQRLSKPLPPLAPPVVINHSWRDAE